METHAKNYLENIGQSIKRSVTLKLLSIFVLMMLLMIPVSFVRSLIQERETLKQETINEVSGKWANEQYVYGPILTIPLEMKVIEDDKIRTVHSQAHILPSKLMINGSVAPKSLRRGIYEVVVYDSHLSFSGQFEDVSKYLSELKEYEAFPEDAFLTINISDLRGIKETVVVKWNDQQKEVEPGSNILQLVSSGITVKNILQPAGLNFYDFSFGLQLQGSQFLGFIPLGKETSVHLTSDWKDPSFSGSFLPEDRNVTEDGFIADWQVLELNRNYPQFWIGDSKSQDMQNSSFGVTLLMPANDYQKSMRSAKYALLAISLTFLTFFLVEIFNQGRMHPFQYILIGLALVLFYTLLVSISEHSSFNFAYLISSVSIISIIGLYARSILRNTRHTIALVIILGFTYTFVYITLQVQDYALLIGSIGLTSILAFTMYITRNINWYELSSSKESITRKTSEL
ncbi:MAG: cell envelope integrity protein CreD [Bacteroidales bacterium]